MVVIHSIVPEAAVKKLEPMHVCTYKISISTLHYYN